MQGLYCTNTGSASEVDARLVAVTLLSLCGIDWRLYSPYVLECDWCVDGYAHWHRPSVVRLQPRHLHICMLLAS
jgi:hypothetical protein